jgi:hypothetical protein
VVPTGSEYVDNRDRRHVAPPAVAVRNDDIRHTVGHHDSRGRRATALAFDADHAILGGGRGRCTHVLTVHKLVCAAGPLDILARYSLIAAPTRSPRDHVEPSAAAAVGVEALARRST